MVYGSYSERLLHLSLPLPDLEALANRVTEQPSAEVCDVVSAAVQQGLGRARDGTLSPYELQVEVSQIYPGVTVEQVAWVLVGIVVR